MCLLVHAMSIILKNKRALISRLFDRTGMLALLERLPRKPCLAVLAFHRVGDPGNDPLYRPLISATPEQFEHLVRVLRERYRVLRLEELEAAIDDSGVLHLPEPCVLLTFDDGYRDNVTLALPLLTSLRVPASLFLTSGLIDRTLVPWWDHVAVVVRRSTRSTIETPWGSYDTCSQDREEVIRNVIDRFILQGWSAADTELGALEHAAGVERAEVLDVASKAYLTWEDAALWERSGMSLGAHSVTHKRLAALHDSEQAHELAASRERIETALDAQVQAFAYPFGGADCYSQSTLGHAREAGYRLAFTLRPGVLRPGPISALELPRLAVSHADTVSQLRARLALYHRFGRGVV